MAVRKRRWITRSGEAREAWIVDYVDQRGERHIETYERKRDADARHAAVKVDVGKGVHTAVNKSITVSKAAAQWLEYVTGEGAERSTVEQYQRHVDLHIAPRCGNDKLATITAPRIEQLRDELVRDLSRPMARKALQSLKAILKDAHRRGNVAQNVAAGVTVRKDKRAENHKPQVGIDIPTPVEIEAIVNAAKGRWKPLLLTASFTGLRASELRGLRWRDVDLKKGEISVRQRADQFNEIGKPKSATGVRTFPLRPIVISTLREWKLACPPGDLVFPNGSGGVENLSNVLQRGFHPAQIAAGVTVPVMDENDKPKRDEDGKPVVQAKYYGLQPLRHFFASLCINRRADGGLELPPKIVQEWLGHSTITLTLDTYSHLWPTGGDVTAITTDLERALS
jgi:integrase